MAVRDVKNFKFLSEAIVQRFRDPNLKSFKGIPYEPQTNPRSIFGQVYSTFREMIGKGLNLHQYLNIGERSVLESLYRNLQSDINLKFLNNPDSILNDPRFELSDQYYLEQSPEVIAAEQLEAVPAQAPGGTPVSAMPGGMHLPSAPRISFGSRRVDNVPHAPEPPPPKSELVTANKSGVVQEAPSGAKLVTASSSGVIKEAPPKQIFIANEKGIVTGIRNIKSPSWLKTFGSNAQIFANRNLGKVFDGLKGIGGGLGRGIAGGIGGGLEAAAPSLGRAFRGGLNGIERMTRPGGLSGGGGISSITKVGKGRGKWVFIFALLGMMFLTTLLGVLPGSAPPGQAGPLPPPGGGGGDISKCTFTRASNPQLIKSSILAGWISSAAASAGISPAVLASVAMHENQNFVASADNNHDAIKSNQFCNRGLLFCEKNGQVLHSKDHENDPCTSNEITNGAKTAQAVGLMQLLDIYNPGKDLCSITENLAIAAAKLKADGITAQPTQDEVNKAIRQYYNSCMYSSYSYCDEVWQDFQNCKVQPVPPGGGSDLASQLVNKITGSAACSNGRVNTSNVDACVPSLRPIPGPRPHLTENAINYSVKQVEGGVLQCVGFVEAVFNNINDQIMNKLLAAYMYIYFPPAGYKFTSKTDKNAIIQLGDMAVWNLSLPNLPYGHIAYVTKTYDNAAFDVAEANWGVPGIVQLRPVGINDPGFAGWLQKK